MQVPIKMILINSDKPFRWTIKQSFQNAFWISTVVLVNNEDSFVMELSSLFSSSAIVVLNTTFNTPSAVARWVWKYLRLNEERIGKKYAGLPVLVLGMDKKFLETPEGKVFRDYKYFHQYLIKPLNLNKFLKALSILSPVDPGSLPIVNQDAPESLLGALEHDLKDISKKFNYNGNEMELKRRFHDIMIDLSNFEFLEKDEKKVLKAKEEVGKLKKEIAKRARNIWE